MELASGILRGLALFAAGRAFQVKGSSDLDSGYAGV